MQLYESELRFKQLQRERCSIPAWSKTEHMEMSVSEKELWRYGGDSCGGDCRGVGDVRYTASGGNNPHHIHFYMKKILLGLSGLVMLSSVFALRTCWTSGDPAEAPAREVSVGTDNQFRTELTGSWHLDSEKNDLTAFPDSFSAYAELGNRL